MPLSGRYGLVMDEESRASQVLSEVLRFLPSPAPDNGHFHVLDSWVDGDAICVVYRGWWFDGTLGLRRRIEPDVPLDRVVDYVLMQELGEPPGSLVEGVVPDEDGITWWHGDRAEWRDYA